MSIEEFVRRGQVAQAAVDEAVTPGSKGDLWQMAATMKRDAEELRRLHQEVAEQEEFVVYRVRRWLAFHQKSAIAKQMGVSPQYLSDIERGRRKISPSFLEKLIAYATERCK